MAMRPSSRVLRNCLKPSPSSPRRLSAGTRQSSNVRPWVSRDVPAELVVRRLDDEAPGAGRHHDRRDLRRAVLVRAGARGHGDDGGDVGAGVRDEGLGAVDDPLVAVADGSRAGRTGVGAGLGLGEAEAGEGAAGDEVGQEALLLLLGAVGEDRVDAEADARRQRDADRLVDAAELLDGDAEAREVAGLARAAVLLRHDEAEQPEVAHLRHEVGREVGGGVPLGDVGRDLLLGEVADDHPEVLVVLAELEHRCSPEGVAAITRS